MSKLFNPISLNPTPYIAGLDPSITPPLPHKGTGRDVTTLSPSEAKRSGCISECLSTIWKCVADALKALVNFLFCRSEPLETNKPVQRPSEPTQTSLPKTDPKPIVESPAPTQLSLPIVPTIKAPEPVISANPAEKILSRYVIKGGWLYNKTSLVSTGINVTTVAKIVAFSARILPNTGHKIRFQTQKFLVFKTSTLHIYSLAQRTQVGEGSDGIVFKILDVTAGRFVALKKLHKESSKADLEKETSSDKEERLKKVAGFQKEVAVMKRITTREAEEYHYFEYRDPAKETNIPVMISPLAQGDLSQFITQLTAAERLDCCDQLLSELQSLASLNYFFGDLKDSNLLVSSINGRKTYRLCDVGSVQDLTQSTPDFHSLYTPRFMHNEDYLLRGKFRTLPKPTTEQVQEARKLAYALDIFALGTLFYQVLMGESSFPYERATIGKKFQIGDENSAKTNLLAKGYPEGLCSLVESMTERDYRKRPSIEKIRQKLNTFL